MLALAVLRTRTSKTEYVPFTALFLVFCRELLPMAQFPFNIAVQLLQTASKEFGCFFCLGQVSESRYERRIDTRWLKGLTAIMSSVSEILFATGVSSSRKVGTSTSVRSKIEENSAMFCEKGRTRTFKCSSCSSCDGS